MKYLETVKDFYTGRISEDVCSIKSLSLNNMIENYYVV